MKRSPLVSIIAVIQLIALLQIGVSYYGTKAWWAMQSDTHTIMLIGGDYAVKYYDSLVRRTSAVMTLWGLALGVSSLGMSTIAALLLRKEKK